MGFAIAIDGPGGAGKSTVARLLAKELGFVYVDTGAMYRAVALYCIERGISLEDEAGIVNALPDIFIHIKYVDGVQHIYLCGENVTDEIRTQAVADGSSKVAVIKAVREKLVRLQQELAREGDVVMDGRDIGTRVLPEAQVKIYLTASADERTRRRMGELKAKGMDQTYDEVKKEIEERDYRDKNRAADPLRQAEDAVLLDCSRMNVDEVIGEILEIVRRNRFEKN